MKTRKRPVELHDSPEHRAIPLDRIEFRADDEDDNTLHLEGYASTFEPYEMYGGPAQGGWIEQLDKRAFDKTLREKPDLHLLINHAGMPLARTKSGNLELSTDERGLKVCAKLDKRDPEVQSLAIKMERGDMDEMSFAFRVKAQSWAATDEFPDDNQALRTINEVSLHKGDVSVVNWGANPNTHAEVLSAPELLRAFVECEDFAEVRGNDDLVKSVLEKLGAPNVTIENLVVDDTDDRRGVITGYIELLHHDPDGSVQRIKFLNGAAVRTWLAAQVLSCRQIEAQNPDSRPEIGAEESGFTVDDELRQVLVELFGPDEKREEFGLSSHPILEGSVEGLTEFLSQLTEVQAAAIRAVLDAADDSAQEAHEEERTEPKGMSLSLALALAEL